MGDSIEAMRSGASSLPKIFVFCNHCRPGWHDMMAIAEDGAVLAGHICSDHGYANHDMGILPNGWKRDLYAKHYPDGFEVIGVEWDKQTPEFKAALEKAEAIGKAEREKEAAGA